MNVIIAGSRNFNNYELLKTQCDLILSHNKNVSIISGMARGADTLGVQYAKERRYPILSYQADWNRYGKKAGYIRNEEMAKVGDMLIAFWDGSSKGTLNMIYLANQYKLEVHVIRFD